MLNFKTDTINNKIVFITMNDYKTYGDKLNYEIDRDEPGYASFTVNNILNADVLEELDQLLVLSLTIEFIIYAHEEDIYDHPEAKLLAEAKLLVQINTETEELSVEKIKFSNQLIDYFEKFDVSDYPTKNSFTVSAQVIETY